MKVSLKYLIKNIVLCTRLFRRPSVLYCVHHALLPTIFVRMPSAKLRDALFLSPSPYETQLNQDIFALLANRFKRGYFVEIGANDGYMLSNTIYLEEQFGWDGLLVEANARYRESLESRKARSVIAAVVEKEGYYEFSDSGLYGGIVELLDKRHEKKTKVVGSISVWGTTLQQILDENEAPEIIDFISIDVEGAEVPIVEQMCRLQGYRFMSGCIEYNFRQGDYKRIADLLRRSGYRIVWEGQTESDLFFVDEGYSKDA